MSGKIALIDGDILRYECAAIGERNGEILGFDFVKNIFDERIRLILDGCSAETAKLFITADKSTHRMACRSGYELESFTPNFREALAVGKSYKGTRKQDKPFHWINLTAYILSLENTRIAMGCEADDLIGIEGYGRDDVIICTRDKDLRQIPGTHYAWECGKNQPEWGPVTYDEVGEIELLRTKSSNKIRGGGFKFFCSQLLTGDVVDNIGGAKGIGPVKAYSLLADCTSERSCFDTVVRCYQELAPDNWKELLKEQCSLVWIVRERNPDGTLKHFDVEEWLST